MTTRLPFRLLTGLALLAASLGITPSPVLAADDVVTPCTEDAFNAVLSRVQASGGGTITFNCGPAMHTIVFTAPKAITSAVTIEGAGRITLNGGDATSLFLVNFGKSLTIRGLTLTRSGGPAIGNFGRLDVIDSQFLQNAATNGPGGAISSIGTAALTNTLIISNTASQHGGGLYNAGTLTISGGQISGNLATTTGGGLYNAGTLSMTNAMIISNTASQNGGGLYNLSTLTITGGLISANLANESGGGIYNAGTMTMTQSALTGNVAALSGGGLSGLNSETLIDASSLQANSAPTGGGIYYQGGNLILTQVLVANNGNKENVAGYADTGGGVYLGGAGGVFTFTAVTLWQNRATDGGGILQLNGSLTLRNSTLSGNRALEFGGGLHRRGGSVTIQQATITDNRVDTTDPSQGGGAGVFSEPGGGSLVLTSTLLSGNRRSSTQAPLNCGGAAPTASFSLSSDGSCGFGPARNNIALPLGPLQNNGGFTPTHLLPQGSPAIDAGSSAGCPAADQRGLSRPIGATCDVGAVEARPADFVTRLYLPTLQK